MTEQSFFPGFDDGKAPDALRTIGEVATALGIRQHILRYWEEQFPMLKPVKRSGGRRYYRPEDIQLLVTINRLVHHEGYTLRGARLVLQDGDAKATPAKPTQAKPSESPVRPVTAELRAIRDRLAAALASA